MVLTASSRLAELASQLTPAQAQTIDHLLHSVKQLSASHPPAPLAGLPTPMHSASRNKPLMPKSTVPPVLTAMPLVYYYPPQSPCQPLPVSLSPCQALCVSVSSPAHTSPQGGGPSGRSPLRCPPGPLCLPPAPVSPLDCSVYIVCDCEPARPLPQAVWTGSPQACSPVPRPAATPLSHQDQQAQEAMPLQELTVPQAVRPLPHTLHVLHVLPCSVLRLWLLCCAVAMLSAETVAAVLCCSHAQC